MDVCCNVQTAVDSKNKLTAEFEAANKAEDNNQISVMSARACGILETEEITVAVDAGYDSVQDIVTSMQAENFLLRFLHITSNGQLTYWEV